MEHEFTERRRSPRVSIENATIVALHVSVPVRLLGLSPDGLRMACRVPLRAGSTVRVVGGFAGRRLQVELSVDEVSNRLDEGVGGYVLGGSLPSFDPTARQVIAAMLGANGRRPDVEPASRVDRGRSETRPVAAPGYQFSNHTPAATTSASTATRMPHVCQPSTAKGGRRDAVIPASL
jgi:hypothetical protein